MIFRKDKILTVGILLIVLGWGIFGMGVFDIQANTSISGNDGTDEPRYITGTIIPGNQFDITTQPGETVVDLTPGNNVVNTIGNDPEEIAREEQRIIDEKAKGSLGLLDYLGLAFSYILYGIAYGLGAILMLVTQVMMRIATYDGFMKQSAVVAGWTITRDVCNNFFIIFMIIMAIGTTLNLQTYHWRNMLPKVLLMAVLINFSKLFVGVMIDASQVVMLTFAAPIATTTGYNIILKAFGLPSWAGIKSLADNFTSGKDPAFNGIEWLDIFAALIFAIIATISALIVITIIAIILVYRIVMLWFLIILSPLWIFAKAFNKLSEISGTWEAEIKKYLVVGPAMMFFLYLSFMTMYTAIGSNNNNAKNTLGIDSTTEGNASIVDPSVAGRIDSGTADISNMASFNGVINLLIVIGLLWGSLMMGQRFGGAASKWAGTGMNLMKKWTGANLAGSLGKKAGNLASKVPGIVGKKVAQTAGTAGLGLATQATRLAAKVAGSGPEGGLTKLADFGSQWRKDVLGKRRDARRDKLDKFMGKVGLGSDEAKEAWGQFTNTGLAKGVKKFGVRAGGAVAGTAAVLATGGLGLIPAALAGSAAAYFGGGKRLLEMGLGGLGKSRAEKRKAQQDKINAEQAVTAQVEESFEADKNKNINNQTEVERKKRDDKIKQENDDLNEFKNKSRAALKANSAQQEIDKINSTVIDDNNKLNGGNFDPKLIKALENKQGWTSGQEITQSMLDKAKKDVLENSTEGKTWKRDIDAYNNSLEIMTQARDNNVGKINDIYGDNINTIKDAENLKTQRNITNELDRKVSSGEISQVEKDRWEGERTAKVKLEFETNNLGAELQKEMEAINAGGVYNGKNYSGLNASQLDNARREAQTRHDNAKNNLNQIYNDEIEKVQPKQPKPTKIDDFLKDYEPYAHENWVSQAVGKKASKDRESRERIISSMEAGGDDLFNGNSTFRPGTFYSGSGQTSQQYKIFESLVGSNKGIQQMVIALNNLGPTLKGDQAKLVEELKKGIAAYSKGGGDTSKLSGMITILNDKVTVDKDGNPKDKKTVKDYEADVMSKQ